MAQQHASEKSEMQQEISRLREDVQRCRSSMVGLEQAHVSSSDKASQQTNQTAAALQHSRSVEVKLSSVQQDLMMRVNDANARCDRQQHALQALTQELSFVKQSHAKGQENIENVVDTVRGALQAQITDMQTRHSTTRHSLEQLTSEVGTTNTRLQQHLQQWSDVSAKTDGAIQQLQMHASTSGKQAQDMSTR